MRLYLIDDLRRQTAALRHYALVGSIMLVLFFALDRGLAWLLRHGLERTYGLSEPAPVLVIGHSHALLAIDKVALERGLGMKVAMYTRQGAQVRDRLTMVQHFLAENGASLRTVIYAVDSHLLTPGGLSRNSYEMFLPFLDSPPVAQYLDEENLPRTRRALFVAVRTARYNEATLGFAIRGLAGRWDNLKAGTVDTHRLQREIAGGKYRRIEIDPTQRRLFEQTLDVLGTRNIRVILVNFPTLDIVNQVEPERRSEVLRILRSYADVKAGIEYLDYNPDFSDRHELFYDAVHLNPTGQREITERLIRDLRGVLAPPPSQ